MGKQTVRTQRPAQPRGYHIGVAHATYNSQIVEVLLMGVLECLGQEQVKLVQVPGALELPHALRLLANGKPRPASLVALGCVIRGDTTHYDIVCNVSAHALQRVDEATGIAVINGILTCEDAAQAVTRARNKGIEFAEAAIAMAELGGIAP